MAALCINAKFRRDVLQRAVSTVRNTLKEEVKTHAQMWLER
jgi:hypothetical protein